MFGIFKKIGWLFRVGKEVQEAVDAWRSVADEAAVLSAKYAELADLPDDIRSFLPKVRRAFDETKDIVS